MKPLLAVHCILLACFFGLVPVSATEDPSASTKITLHWQTNFTEALAQARRENKVVVVNFTGSDWCVWCHRLRDEVFLTKPFASFAEKDAVLVELDFPRKQTLTPEQKNKTTHWQKNIPSPATLLFSCFHQTEN